MSLSARNQIKGVITKLNIGAVNAEVTIEVAAQVEIVSIITKQSCEALALQVGNEAYAIIKAPNVMVGVE